MAGRNLDRRQWVAENGDLLTIEGEVTLTDWAAQRTQSRLRYERWCDNRLVDVQMEPMAQRFWGMEEFVLALAAVGFSDVQVSGGYERGRPVRSGDHVMTFEAVRA
jgi:hypothetical protein